MSGSATYVIRKPVTFGLLAAALVILGLDVALVLQNRTLKGELAAPPPLLPRLGTRVPSIRGGGLSGGEVDLSFDGRGPGTLLLVFSTVCEVCDLNWPNWASVARSARDKGYRIVYANIGPPPGSGYLENHPTGSGVVLAELDPKFQVALNLRLTPLTILVSSDGEVRRVWPGLLGASSLADLRREVGVGSR